MCDTDGDVRVPELLDSEAPSVAGGARSMKVNIRDFYACEALFHKPVLGNSSFLHKIVLRNYFPTSFSNLLDDGAPFDTGMSGSAQGTFPFTGISIQQCTYR